MGPIDVFSPGGRVDTARLRDQHPGGAAEETSPPPRTLPASAGALRSPAGPAATAAPGRPGAGPGETIRVAGSSFDVRAPFLPTDRGNRAGEIPRG